MIMADKYNHIRRWEANIYVKKYLRFDKSESLKVKVERRHFMGHPVFVIEYRLSGKPVNVSALLLS